MLSSNELKIFLALLLAFANELGLSDRAMGELLGVAHKTMSRWLHAAREIETDGTTARSIYRNMATEIQKKVKYLQISVDPVDLTVNYSRAARVQFLKTTLANRRV